MNIKEFIIKWALISITILAGIAKISSTYKIDHKITLEGSKWDKQIELTVHHKNV